MNRFMATAIGATVFAVLIGPRGPLGGFWAPSPTAPHVDGPLLAGFITENMVENIAFGLGVAILLFGRPWFLARTADPARATAGWLATVWLFASWMPHAALHLHIGMRPTALLLVEWVFHGGAIAAITALLWAFATRRQMA
jgi:hypothetical protein